MAEKRDYYEVLGLSKNATDDEIKKAYRKAAKANHPDLHPDDKEAETRFKEINEAYEVLSDSTKRARYDQFGFDGPNMGGAGGSGFGGFGGADGFGDIFDFFFNGQQGGRSRQHNGPQRGNDLRYNITLTFEEAAFGCTKEFKFQRNETCDACGGSGAKAGTSPKTCETCHGTGRVRQSVQSLFGQVVQEGACGTCGGTGKIIVDKCPKCSGRGQVRMMRTATVKFPAGVDDGAVKTLSGQGEPGKNGGPAGDLYVYVTVKPHKFFARDQYDLHCEIPISFTQAALGGEIDVPTLEEPVKYDLPEGTQNDTVFRIRNQGIKQLHGNGKGDLYFKVRVEVPKRLNEEQKNLLRELESSLTGKEYEGRKSFFERMKNNFKK